jgi:hypothetical protein
MQKRKFYWLFKGLVCVFWVSTAVFGQDGVFTKNATTESASSETMFPKQTTEKKRRFELGAQFTSLMRDGDGDRNGFGGRFGYDVATFGAGKYVVTAESELNYFPGTQYFLDSRRQGRVFQGLFGAKIGRKFNKFGIFAKARPGFTQYTNGKQVVTGTNSNPIFQAKSETNFATDVGGVLEFYPSKKLVTRFDFGDTIARFGRQQTTFYDFFNQRIVPMTLPSETKHNFQFSAGIGLRF